MSDVLVDPLKLGTYGVKKPLEQKGDKIQGLIDGQQRYYPNDNKGGIDEWGAVIKRRHEAFTRQQAEDQLRMAADK